jgi:hypothetical protein
VSFEAELVLQGPDDGLDALPQPVREVTRLFLVFARWADQGKAQAVAGEEGLGVFPGQALVGDDRGARGWPVRRLACQYLPRLLAFPEELGFARPKPVTVPSQVQINSSFALQYQREWLGQ